MNSNSAQPTGLYYWGTRIEVRLGDRVELKRWFRRNEEGCVCYIPGISPKHSELEYEGVRKWAIRTRRGIVYSIAYYPELFQPPKNIRFIERSDTPGMTPDEELN